MEELEELLGAMVDGLSGTLAVIVLLTVVFMVSTGKEIKIREGAISESDEYILDKTNKMVVFKRIDKMKIKDLEFLQSLFLGDVKPKFVLNNSDKVAKGIVNLQVINEMVDRRFGFAVDKNCPETAVGCIIWS